MAKYYDDENQGEEDFQTADDIIGQSISKGSVDAQALRQAAESKRQERSGALGGALGAVAGGIGALFTGNPMLIKTGYEAGSKIGGIAGTAKNKRGEAIMSMLPMADKAFQGMKKAKAKFDKNNPDWDKMGKEERAKYLKDNPDAQDSYDSWFEGGGAEAGSVQGVDTLSNMGGASEGMSDLPIGELADVGSMVA